MAMTEASKGLVKHATSVEKIPMEGGAGIRWMLTHRDGVPNFSMRLIEIPAGQNTPFHSHDYEHEIYVITGELDATIGDTVYRAAQDDFVYIPPNIRHGMKAITDVRIICVVPIKAAKEILGL